MLSDTRSTLALPSRARLILYLILAVAGLLRLARLDLMAFEMDEGVACVFAVRFTHYGLPPLAGIKTSLQFHNSPLFLYVISPALLVTTDPRFAAMLFALLGTVAVYVVYRTGREFFSPAVGLLAAAMMALSPAAVEYSRRLWGHSLIQVLCPIAFYLLLRWVVAGRAKAVFWLALIIAAAQQFHFSGALLWCQVVLAYLLFRPRTDWAGFVAGLALGLLGYIPFFILQADTGFLDLRIIGEAIWRGAGQPRTFSIKPLANWFFAATDLGHNNFLQNDFGLFLAGLPFYRLTRAVAGLAWVAGLTACAVWALRGGTGILPVKEHRQDAYATRRRAVEPLLLLTWSVVPLVVFLLLRVPVVAPYFLVVYPVPFLAIAWLVVEVRQRLGRTGFQPVSSLRRGLQSVAVLLFAGWAAHQMVFNIALRTHLDREGGGKGSYASFASQQAAMRFIANHAPRRTVLVTEEYLDPSRGIDFRYWYLLWTFDHDMERFFPVNREKAEYWYVIRNTNYRIRPDFDEFLAAYPSCDFGFLRVYVIPRPGPWPRFGSLQPAAST